ncbi:hypothetical protein [Nocardioides sp.]|uniref:hypothetical protein n=1 Tax=Nocardioides sp. TaxID=35761 RepID=UPI002608D9E8|nr:hypothetical protein [Nocardioides sp.]
MPNNELGDFQTPSALALRCLTVLGVPAHARVLEPTCGRGAFLEAAATLSPDTERIGIELQPAYAAEARRWADVRVANIFTTDLRRDLTWRSDGPLYVVGNPPWVTSADLRRMESSNLPVKENLKGARGLDAMLGSSNFDVAEYIIARALEAHRDQPVVLGMLCKTQVARNVLGHAAAQGWPVAEAHLYRIDARTWFDAGVDACWFTVRLDAGRPTDHTCLIHDDLFATTPDVEGRRFGVVDGLVVSDVARYTAVREADGRSPYEWRSGLKHDAARVFELAALPEPATQAGVPVDLESEYVLPLLKSTDLFRGRHRELGRWVIVPQRTFGAETTTLARTAPRLWRYLNEHAAVLDARRSSIYRNRPRFSVFGHGEYTYAPYKVAVSGLHKEPRFRLLGPLRDQPVVLDDTCYFAPFSDPTEAAVATAVLTSRPCLDLIDSLVFWDSKRPVTKKVLARLDLNRLPLDPASVVTQAGAYAAEAGLTFDADAARGMVGALGRRHD